MNLYTKWTPDGHRFLPKYSTKYFEILISFSIYDIGMVAY